MVHAAATREQAARQFRDHLNHLLARTLTQTPLVQFTLLGRMNVAFRQGGVPARASLSTRFGRMALYIGQVLDFENQTAGRVRLMTVEYKYTLGPEASVEPLLRWEYVRTRPPGAHRQWCRHHLQGDVRLPLGDGVSLNDFHLPTGYVTIEEIIRFCIIDLAVEPLSNDWNAILDDSYEQFKRGFVATVTAKPPSGKKYRLRSKPHRR